jgi:hypothetical protein
LAKGQVRVLAKAQVRVLAKGQVRVLAKAQTDFAQPEAESKQSGRIHGAVGFERTQFAVPRVRTGGVSHRRHHVSLRLASANPTVLQLHSKHLDAAAVPHAVAAAGFVALVVAAGADTDLG